MAQKKKKSAGEAAGDDKSSGKKSDVVSLTLVKGCTFTDGDQKYVSGKTYEVSEKAAASLIASGCWKKL